MKPGRHADGGGLYLSVDADGSRKRWVLLYTLKGKRREMGLGSASGPHAVSLKEAREAAEKARQQIRDGIDPIAAKRRSDAEKQIPTFGEMADRHIAAMEPDWKNEKHKAQWKMTLGRVRDKEGNLLREGYCLSLRDIPVNEITTEDVQAVLDPIWVVKRETASRIRGRIEAVLDAAKAAGFRSGENPAAWRGHMKLLLPNKKKMARGHHAAMPYADMPAFIAKLREAKGVGALALEFAILTAARSGEVRYAVWSEINFETAVWTVPAERMKAGKEHRVPLTDRAVAILRTVAALRRECDTDDREALVFPGAAFRKPLSDMTLAAVLRRMNLGHRTSFPRELAEAALAHAVGNAVEQAYRRSDALNKRRKLMEAWVAFCEPKAGNVLSFDSAGKRAADRQAMHQGA
jgi:integrase